MIDHKPQPWFFEPIRINKYWKNQKKGNDKSNRGIYGIDASQYFFPNRDRIYSIFQNVSGYLFITKIKLRMIMQVMAQDTVLKQTSSWKNTTFLMKLFNLSIIIENVADYLYCST